MPRVLYITTVPQTLNFFRGLLGYLKERGMDVHVASSPGDELLQFGDRERVHTHAVPMTREISPITDVSSLLRLIAVLRKVRPSIVHAHTPKAGLLGMAAATIARVPIRIYTIHGLPFMTRSLSEIHVTV